MPSRDDSSACVAVADLLKLSAASRRVVGLLDASALAGRAARELGGLVGTDVTALGVRESQNTIVTRGGWHVRNTAVRNGLQIPIGDVLASPFCRTMETARLAFGKATPMNEVRGGPVKSDDPARYDGLRTLLATPIPKGSNLVIVSHGNPFHAVAGPPYLAEGEIAVVQPRGEARFDIVSRIRLETWSSLRGAGGSS